MGSDGCAGLSELLREQGFMKLAKCESDGPLLCLSPGAGLGDGTYG